MNINDDARPQGDNVTETREFQDGKENDNRGVQGEGSLKGDRPWENAASNLESRVEERFGVLPNFFRLAPETPEITEKLWGFAEAAYLDNPLPSVFKERLFVHLSRFCAVRYCIGRHVGFLVGLGRPAGDPAVRTQSIADVVITSALSWYVQGLEERSGLKIGLRIPDNFGRLPSEMELLIFRLVQECLTNIHRQDRKSVV